MQQPIQESVVRIQDELAVTNEEIKTLKPHLQLDTLQERSKIFYLHACNLYDCQSFVTVNILL